MFQWLLHRLNNNIKLILLLSLWAARCKKEPKTKNIVVYEFINVPFTATRQA